MKCFTNGNDCPYRDSCDKKNKDGSCFKGCITFHEIDLLFFYTKIPKRYLQPFKLFPGNLDEDNYVLLSQIKNNIKTLVEQGFNLYIVSSNKQNGKTSWAIKIVQNYLHLIKQEAGSRKRALYLDVNAYLTNLKASFNNKDDDELKMIGRDLDTLDIIIWDNIDECKLSEWDKNLLKQHIKKRLSENLSNIFVGNNVDYKLINFIGEDLKFYVQDNSSIIPLVDLRGDKND